MSWRSKLDQLVGLLEKIPQPQSFEAKTGVYEPYFTIELRASSWELTPYANYTRLDGTPGREIRLSLSVMDSSKVNISQTELDSLFFLEADANHNSRSIFSYTQPVGFLLDWLAKSNILVKEAAHKQARPVAVHEETSKIVLNLHRTRSGYLLTPSLQFADGTSLTLDNSVVILAANPIYLLFDANLYRIESALPAVFWNNYFRTHEQFEIPNPELDDFVRIYLGHLLPVLDWQSLGDDIRHISSSLEGKTLYFSEWNNHLYIDVKFAYGNHMLPAYPESDQSIATERNSLCIVTRNRKKEDRARQLLLNNGLIFRAGYWHIAAEYNSLDWMRTIVPKLENAGFAISGEDALTRHRVRRQQGRIQIRVKRNKNWLDISYSIMAGREAVEVPDLLRQLNGSRSYLKLSDGSYLHLDESLNERIRMFSELLDFKTGQGTLRLPMAGVAMVRELNDLNESIRFDKKTESLLEQYKKFDNIESVGPPESLSGKLRKYQQYGLDWLHFLDGFSFGGILADDMGLGKTVQVISLLLKLRESGRLKGPVLIVVPLTLVFNWQEEFQKFAPMIRVLRYYGNKGDRARLLRKLSEFDVLLCSYGVVLQDQKQLSAIQLDYVILDESQKIKNPDTKTYKAIQKLNAAHLLGLTGTPVENSLVDLWAQFNFVNPGLLGTLKQFEHKYIEIDAQTREERIPLLKRLIYPFILRRTKEEVERELPPLTEIVQYVEMTDIQRSTYNAALAKLRGDLFKQIDDVGIKKSRLKIVEALTYLRQIACHPAILDDQIDLNESGKVQLLRETLTDLLNKGHKILIFSQFVRFLGLIRRIFEEEGWKYEYLDGKVRDRAKHIHNFQDNPDISAFLISLKAGGLGLNLTAADYVIHLDPWWNPAVEQQATDRAHRIGQKRRVFVYKYIVRNSVEERILKLQQKKKELSDELITSDTGFVKDLSKDDLQLIFDSFS